MDKEIKILIGVSAVVTLIGFVGINQCARPKPTAAEMAELIDSPTESREIDVPSSRELAERFNRITKDYAEEDKRYRNSLAQFEESTKSLEAHRKLEAQQIAEMKAKMKAIGPRQESKALTFDKRVRLSRERALRRYPDAGDGDSAFSRKMIEIADRLEAEGNEMVYQPEAPELVADMAAKELSIAPAK